MRKVLTFIARFIASILAILFVITALLALPLFNVGAHLFGPAIYKRALAEQNIYERLPALAAEQVVYSAQYNPCAENPESEECQAEGPPGEDEPTGEGGLPPFLQDLTQEDYEFMISSLAPPDWLQAQVEGVIDQFFAYLSFAKPDATLKISLAELKQRIAGEQGTEAGMRQAHAQPPCTEEQIEIIESDAEVTPEEMPLCNPPKPLAEKYAQKVQQTLRAVAEDIPDETTVDLSKLGEEEADVEAPPEEEGPFGGDPRPILQAVRWLMLLSPLIPSGLLLLITLFGVRSWKGWLRWWGIPLLIVGIIECVLALAAMPAANWAIATYVLPKAPAGLTQNLVTAGLDVARHVIRTVVTWIGVEAGAIALLGLVLIVISFFVKGNPAKPSAETAPIAEHQVQIEQG
jgi:hypothetical protein